MSGLLDEMGLEAGAPLRLFAIPTASVMLASLATALPFAASAPLLPPAGFLLFIAWRLLRSDIWPIWIGIPLGFWDDLLSGQPVGSAVALWTATMLAMEIVDRRIVWRGFWMDWAIGGVALALVLAGGALLAGQGIVGAVWLTLPQLLWSWFLLPLAMRIVHRLDRWRIGV